MAHRKVKFIFWIGSILSLMAAGGIILCVLGGCTVSPKIIPAATPTFSGNSQDGGVIDLGPAGKGPAHVDAEWVLAYDLLILKYGKDMSPALKQDAGLTELPDGTYLVDLEHLADKNVMATMKRSGIAP